MNTNRAYQKTLHFLSRPAVLLLLAVLLINDFVLRRLWPSWLTGKLGDFAWLFVAPAVAALLLACLVPARWKRQEKLVGLLAYGLTALAFVLLKTVPAFRDAALQIWQAGLGFPAAVVIDPTDLVALVMLALSAAVWFHEKSIHVQVPLRAWLALPLFALFTLADAAAPDYGIACLSLQDNQVIASAGYSSFASRDGGLTWTGLASGGQPCMAPRPKDPILLNLTGLQVRSYAGSRIEISQDGGVTWKVEYALTGSTEPRDAYYEKTAGGNPILQPGPLDALLDPATGSIIFAMGHQGLLVRQANAAYTWAPAGSYRPANLSDPAAFLTVMGGELALAGGLALLLLAAWALAVHKSGWVHKALVILAWLAWGVGAYLFSPALASGYSIQMSWMVLAGMLVLALPLGIMGVVTLAQNAGLRVLPTALAAGLAFFVPYALWYINAIPAYTIAMLAAGVIALVCAIFGFAQAARRSKAAPENPH